MDGKNLHTFLTAAKVLNFSQAAYSLNLTQPSVTSRIKALEAELGTELFSRTKKGIVLTPAGKAFVPFANQMLELEHRSKDILSSFTRQQYLVVGCTSVSGAHILPPIIQLLRKIRPALKIRICTGHQNSLVEKLLRGTIDVGLTTFPTSHHRIEYTHIWNDPIYLVCNPEHPLAQRDQCKFSDLQDSIIISLDPEATPEFWLKIDQILRVGQIPFGQELMVDSLFVAKSLLTYEKKAVAFLPRLAVARELEENKLTAIPLDWEEPVHNRLFSIVLRHATNKAVPVFLQALHEFCHQDGPGKLAIGLDLNS